MSRLQFTSGFHENENGKSPDAQSKHVRLRDHFATRIQAGQIKEGEMLPSELRIAETWNVARSTVRQAMSTLERDGLVRRIHGKGTYVHERARQRMKRGQDLFALILPEAEAGFYPSLQKSFEGAAAELNSQVIVCNSRNEIDRQGNAILQLIDLQVAGVAIVPTTSPPTPAFHVRQLQLHGIPVVCCSRRVEGISVPLLAIPFEDVGRMAGEAIRQQGHLRVAFFSGMLTEAVKKMQCGFQAAMGDDAKIQFLHGTSVSPSVADHEQQVTAHLDRMQREGNLPTAIFATFDSFAELLYLLLSQRGIRVPEDVSIVGFGGTRRTGALVSRLTSIALHEHELGQRAVTILGQMRIGTTPMDSVEHTFISVSLISGQTLQPPKNIKGLSG